ncbi:MAG: DMT family transporter [Bacteroidales bacterium]|nr:DMT family transporter [Bacteroidales bacterium]
MNYHGEIIAIFVACSWTCTALFFEYASNRIGSLQLNLIRLVFAILLIGFALFFFTGSAFPQKADSATWFWLSLSGLVGFVFGDLCLFYSYTLITARFSQLFMTLAPPLAALSGFLILDERMGSLGLLGMVITLTGIAISVFKRNKEKGVHLRLPLRGMLIAMGGALGQGLGIVLSKKGMQSYEASIGSQEFFPVYIPLAATQIRIVTGIIGFTLIIYLSGRKRQLYAAVKNKKGMWASFGGAFFGPFLGVTLSLLAVQRTNTGIASTIMATVPILILIPHAIMHKKLPTAVEVVGAALCVAGVALFFQ